MPIGIARAGASEFHHQWDFENNCGFSCFEKQVRCNEFQVQRAPIHDEEIST